MITYYQIVQMTRTRSGAGGSNDPSSSGGGDDLRNAPPPPTPTAKELFTQFLWSQRNIEQLLRDNFAAGHDFRPVAAPN